MNILFYLLNPNKKNCLTDNQIKNRTFRRLSIPVIARGGAEVLIARGGAAGPKLCDGVMKNLGRRSKQTVKKERLIKKRSFLSAHSGRR